MASGLIPLRAPPAEEDMRVNQAFREFCRERGMHGVLLARARNQEHASHGLSVLMAHRMRDPDISMVCAHLEMHLETWLMMMLCEAETRKHYAISAG